MSKDSNLQLPLLKLFDRLRKAGLPLGIDEYKLALNALQSGFGIKDHEALARLCRTLWVKSDEERLLFNYHFEQVMAEEAELSTLLDDALILPKLEPEKKQRSFNLPRLSLTRKVVWGSTLLLVAGVSIWLVRPQPRKCPYFLNAPSFGAIEGENYIHEISFCKINQNDKLKITAVKTPPWLKLEEYENGKYRLVGKAEKYINKSVHVLDLSGKQVGEFEHWWRTNDIFDNPFRLIFTPNGSYFATIEDKNIVRLWNSSHQQIGKDLQHNGKINDIHFSPDGKFLATASGDGLVRIWDISGKEVRLLKHQKPISKIIFSPDNQRIVTASLDYSNGNYLTYLWDISGKKIADLGENRPEFIAFSANGQRLMTTLWQYSSKNPSGELSVRLWDMSGKKLGESNFSEKQLRFSSSYRDVELSPNGEQIALPAKDKLIVLDILSGKKLAELKQANVNSIKFSLDGQRIVTAAYSDRISRLWKPFQDPFGKQWQRLKHQGKVESVALSLDQRWIATYADDNYVRLWDMSGNELRKIPFTATKNSLSFSPDSNRLIITSEPYSQQVKLELSDATGRKDTQSLDIDVSVKPSFNPNQKWGKFLTDAALIAFALMFCCFLLLFLSSIIVSLLGGAWGVWLDSLIQEKYRNYNNTFISTSVASLLIFAGSSIANIRKNWRICLQRSLMITLLLAPAALLIGLLFNFGVKTLQTPAETENAIAWAMVLIIIIIVFTFNCFWTVRKGVNTGWVGVALALTGIALPAFLAIVLASSLSSSLQSMPIEVSLLVVAIALGLGFAFTRFYQNSRKNQLEGKFRWIRFHLVFTAIILAIALVAGRNDITIFLAFIAIALYLALALIFEAARPETTFARMSVTLVVFVGIIIAIVLGISWIGFSNSTSELTSLLIIALIVALIMAIFLILAGVANLRSAIAVIIAVPVLFALFFLASISSYVSTDFISTATLFVIALAVTWSTAVIIAVGIAITWVESGYKVTALFWSVSVVITSTLLILGYQATSGASNLQIASSIITSLATIQLAAYIGLQAMSGNAKFTSVRNFALVFASAGGTNFAKSDLTNAEFTQATLQAANFRQAKINGTRWFGAKRLDRACGNSYLQYPSIQQLLVTGNGQNQKFDNLDLRGINLRGANLVDASFVNTDLSEADLQGANLSRAKLLHTKLRKTNLAIAQLTGAYIYNCELTPETKLVGVECDYIYTQIPTKNNPDPGRKPEINGRIFKPGELAKVLISLYSTPTNREKN